MLNYQRRNNKSNDSDRRRMSTGSNAFQQLQQQDETYPLHRPNQGRATTAEEGLGSSYGTSTAFSSNYFNSDRSNNFASADPPDSGLNQHLLSKDITASTTSSSSAAMSSSAMMTTLPRRKGTTVTTSTKSISSSQRVLVKTQAGGFLEDARAFAPGSVPHSMVLAATIGFVCGIAAWAYYALLDYSLDLLWKRLPQQVLTYFYGDGAVVAADNDRLLQAFQSLWIPLIGFSMALLVGLTVRFLGEPGDLPYTIKCVHDQGYISMDHVLPMLAASQFSILAGGSLGPEAPLVAICASLGGFVSRRIFRQTSRNMIRKHTLMGMAGALAAFFGVPLGGSLFALEVNSRFGIEYFEHTLEAIFCGEVCLAVFRAFAGLPIANIWTITADKLTASDPLHILYGALLGLVGATTAWLFANFHKLVIGVFRQKGLLQNVNAVPRALTGAVVVVTLGMLVPHSLFWGEFEFQSIATLAPASSLPHVWPTSGLLGFEMNSLSTALIVGMAKLVSISFTVAGGYRGGYIFPAFAAAAALGRAVYFVCPFIPVQLCVLGMAAALNVALTRTAIASTLILSFLSGEQCALPAILASSLMSLFVTAYMPFIQTQHIERNDLDEAIFREYELEVHDEEEEEEEEDNYDISAEEEEDDDDDGYLHNNKNYSEMNQYKDYHHDDASTNGTSATDTLTPLSLVHKCCDDDHHEEKEPRGNGNGCGGVKSNNNNNEDPRIVSLVV